MQIGWISTLNTDGSANLAPYSQFNNVTFDPPMVMCELTLGHICLSALANSLRYHDYPIQSAQIKRHSTVQRKTRSIMQKRLANSAGIWCALSQNFQCWCFRLIFESFLSNMGTPWSSEPICARASLWTRRISHSRTHFRKRSAFQRSNGQRVTHKGELYL